MPITEHYQGQTHELDWPPTRLTYTIKDGTTWMFVNPGELTLPQYIEGIAKGWVQHHFGKLAMQVVGNDPAVPTPASYQHYYIGDPEKRPINRRDAIKPPTAQR